MVLLQTVLILIVIFILPTVVLGEAIYAVSRSTDYELPPGMTQISLETSDGVSIEGLYTNISSSLIVLVHGHGDHSELMYSRYGSIFTQLGFDLLLIDLRNHGRSAHHPPVSMGIEERHDVIVFLNWADTQQWNDVVVMGTSMGSIAGLLAVGELDHLRKIRGIILDSCFSDPIAVMNNNFEKNYIVQPWRWMIVQYLTRLRHKIDSFPDILEKLDNISIPTLVAHGSRDLEAPPTFLLEVDDLGNENIDTVMINGGEHSRLHEHDSFVTAVSNFVEEIM